MGLTRFVYTHSTKKAFAENYCDLQISEFQTVNGYAKYDRSGGSRLREPVSYTHLTLPTN